jgi:hypothetical protein
MNEKPSTAHSSEGQSHPTNRIRKTTHEKHANVINQSAAVTQSDYKQKEAVRCEFSYTQHDEMEKYSNNYMQNQQTHL